MKITVTVRIDVAIKTPLAKLTVPHLTAFSLGPAKLFHLSY